MSLAAMLDPAALESVLGRALESEQLHRVGVACLSFLLLSTVARQASAHWVPQFASFSKVQQGSWVGFIVASIHAVLVSALCAAIVVFPDNSIEKDHVYGWSDRASLAFSISTAFFISDLKNCIFRPDGVAWVYVFHHTACAACYILVQFPFMQYYAVRFLLYELSTPFLNFRMMLLFLGHTDSKLLQTVEKCFGLTFIIVRICMGIPLSIMSFFDGYELWQAQRQHSTVVLFYFILANVAINSLNVYWTTLLIRKATGKRPTTDKSTSGAAKPKATKAAKAA